MSVLRERLRYLELSTVMALMDRKLVPCSITGCRRPAMMVFVKPDWLAALCGQHLEDLDRMKELDHATEQPQPDPER